MRNGARQHQATTQQTRFCVPNKIVRLVPRKLCIECYRYHYEGVAGVLSSSTLKTRNPEMCFYCRSVSYRSSMMTMKMFIVKILLIDIQLDQNIVKTCALHSLLPVTHTTDNMKIVLQKMKMNLRMNSTQTFQGIVMR